MRILYFIHQFYPEYYTGTERFVLNLATMMQKSGHNVKIVTYSFYEHGFYEEKAANLMFRKFTFQAVPVVAFQHRKLPADLNYAFEDEDLALVSENFLRREKPDLVHVGHSMRVGELVKAVIRLGIPYVVTLTDFFTICPKYTLITSGNNLCDGPVNGKACSIHCPEFSADIIRQRLKTARRFLSRAKLVVSPSPFLAQMIRKEFPDLNVRVIRYGLRLDTVRKNTRIYHKDDGLVFCYAGSLNDHKGVHVLIEAFNALRGDLATLRIHGTGPDKKYIDHLRTLASQNPKIEFCGAYSGDQVHETLAAADAVVVPSLWHENTPMIVREALASHVPVICSDVGGVAEQVQHDQTGLLFRMGDAQALSRTLQRVVDNPDILNSLKGNIKSLSLPTIEQEAYAYDRIYRKMELASAW